MSTLTIDVEKQFGDFRLDASIDTCAQRIGVIGPSGAGKSTLAALIAGHVDPDHGHIEFNGDILWDSHQSISRPSHARNIGYLMQDAPLLPHLSVQRNILYPPEASSNSDRFNHLVDVLDLGPLLEHRPSELSGGERRRVSLAQILMSDPDLLILDEPVVGLNKSLKKQVIPELRTALDDTNCPSIVISHEPDVVRALCDRGIAIHNGTTEDVQPLDNLFETDEGRNQAGLSDTNVFRATSHSPRKGGLIAETDKGMEFFLGTSTSLSTTQTVVVSFRASDLILGQSIQGRISTRNRWEGVVESIKDDGDGRLISLNVNEHRIYARVTERTVSDMELKTGDSITILLKSQALRILPA